jgi:ADP-ribosylglycohydrolase
MRNTEQAATQQRIAGALLGVAAGDALGATVEFKSAATIRSQFPHKHRDIVGGGPFDWRAGQGTDDTDLTMAIARAYATTGGSDQLLAAAAANMGDWYRHGPKDIGGTTATALRRIVAGQNPATSGVADDNAAANGSLMRCVTTGLVRPDAMARRSEAAALSRVTHASRRCVEACVAYCDLVAALLDGMPPTAALAWVAGHSPVGDDIKAALIDGPNVPYDRHDASGYVVGNLALAAWALAQPGSFEDILVAVVALGRDADTTGAICGGLLGAAHGASAIPDRWLDRLEYAAEIDDLVPTLARIRSGGVRHRRWWRLPKPTPAADPATPAATSTGGAAGGAAGGAVAELVERLKGIGRVVTIDMDGCAQDGWSCCGRRVSWEGDADCRHERRDVIAAAKALADRERAALVVLSWRSGGDTATRRWLEHVGLDVAAVFVPGGADDLTWMAQRAPAGQIGFKTATIEALRRIGVTVVGAFDDNPKVVAAFDAMGVPNTTQVAHLVSIAPHEWAAGRIGAPKPAGPTNRHSHFSPVRAAARQPALFDRTETARRDDNWDPAWGVDPYDPTYDPGDDFSDFDMELGPPAELHRAADSHRWFAAGA